MIIQRKSEKFFNRELSWIEFNQRVLDEALDRDKPLLERLKFIAISASNLDEFFMVRVGGVMELLRNAYDFKDRSGFTNTELLKAVRKRLKSMIKDQYTTLQDDIMPLLAGKGIFEADIKQLNDEQEKFIDHLFTSEFYPVLTPFALRKNYDFPSNFGSNITLLVRLKKENTKRGFKYALIKIPSNIPRFITLPTDDEQFLFMRAENIISLYVDRLFPEEKIFEVVPFRVLRNANMAVKEDEACDLLERMQGILKARKTSFCSKLEILKSTTEISTKYLRKALKVPYETVYKIDGMLQLSDLFTIAGMSGFDDLKINRWIPCKNPDVKPGESIFTTLSRQDLVLYHPYESFESVVRLVTEASEDPDVMAIKQILYRTSKNSPIINALEKAAHNGKSVSVIVELKARFDEARNIGWAKSLEDAGVQVVYGIKELKTHAKLCIVIRRENVGIKKYCHFGTGNYNDSTAKLYTDISYMTSNEEYGNDATKFFNTITGFSQPINYQHIWAAPTGIRNRILELIADETQRSLSGQKAKIMAKVNSLVDRDIIEALYEASNAGVKILLNVRGICCLRPGVNGLSENIKVVSVIDRFLEHARAMYFHQGGEYKIFISSADWMPRNLDRRVELLVNISDEKSKKKVKHILKKTLKDNVQARVMGEDGAFYIPENPASAHRSQKFFYDEAKKKEIQSKDIRTSHIETHTPS